MSDELKKFLAHELDELKRNKVRAIALGVCAAVLMVFWANDDTSNENINLTEQPTTQPVTRDLPVKQLPAPKNLDGVVPIVGATADALIVADPFAGAVKPKPLPKKIPPPSIPIEPPQLQPREKILLTGTAISGARKTAMFLRGKETLFLTVGDEVNGRRIVDIGADFVTFSDGTRVYLQKEMN